eukprot:m.1561011 g.1561011  ORF g.1561011 m.1561011 type:complete len:518 (+) comp25277_c0_seq63:266-1819(+)
MDPLTKLAAEVAQVGGKIVGDGRVVDLTRCNIVEPVNHNGGDYGNMHHGVIAGIVGTMLSASRNRRRLITGLKIDCNIIADYGIYLICDEIESFYSSTTLEAETTSGDIGTAEASVASPEALTDSDSDSGSQSDNDDTRVHYRAISTLQTLSAASCGLTGQTDALQRLLSCRHVAWKELDLNSNNLIANVYGLATGLSACHALTSLNLSFCGLDAAALDAVIKALALNTDGVLETLVLDANALGDLGGAILADMLAMNTTLERLSIKDCGIAAAGGHPLGEALLDNRTLTSIALTGNPVGDAAVQTLVNAMAFNSARQVIIDDEHGEAMGDDMYRRLQNASDFSDDVREYLAVCVDAWDQFEGKRVDDVDRTLWTSRGFSAKAAQYLVGVLRDLHCDVVTSILETFTGDVLDAVLRSGADSIVSPEVLTALATATASPVAVTIGKTDLGVQPRALKHICRRTLRCATGPQILTSLLCGREAVPITLRHFLLYGAEFAVAGTTTAAEIYDARQACEAP